jgi:hypothetical protein
MMNGMIRITENTTHRTVRPREGVTERQYEISPAVTVVYDQRPGYGARISVDRVVPSVGWGRDVLYLDDAATTDARLHLPPTHLLSPAQLLDQLRMFLPSTHLVAQWIEEASPDQLRAITRGDIRDMLGSQDQQVRTLGIRLARLLS